MSCSGSQVYWLADVFGTIFFFLTGSKLSKAVFNLVFSTVTYLEIMSNLTLAGLYRVGSRYLLTVLMFSRYQSQLLLNLLVMPLVVPRADTKCLLACMILQFVSCVYLFRLLYP